jgi:sec-independent protein translocase protein TatA
MFGLGFLEWIVILVVVLLVFGAGKLPQIGDALGRSIKNFKRAASGGNEIEVGKKKEIEGSARKADDGVEDADVVPAGKTTERK